MQAEKRRIAASILLFLQAALLVIFSFFVLADPTFTKESLAVGRIEFFAALLIVCLGAMVWRGWLGAVILATALCGLELVIGGFLLLISVLEFGLVLGPVVYTLAIPAPFIPSAVLALPTVILLVSILVRAAARPPSASPARGLAAQSRDQKR